MNLKLITPPATEPISLQDAKLYLKVDHTHEDTLIQSFITTAREYCETYTRRAFVAQEWEMNLDSFQNEIFLPLPPLQSVSSITYKNKDGFTNAINAADYIVDANSNTARIVPINQWPSFDPFPVNPIKITFTAGYTNTPARLKQAMYMLISHFYENREIIIVGTILTQVPFTIETLLRPLKAGWF